MSSLEELLSKLTFDQTVSNIHFVYYDSETMEIQKISPIKNNNTSFVISVDSLLVQPILDGTSRLGDYIVYFDYSLKDYSIKRKKQSLNSIIKLIQIESQLSNADLNIELDSKNILFVLNSSLHDHIKNDNSFLYFYVTENNNPFKLIKKFTVQTKDLLTPVQVEHQLLSKTLHAGVSIYTDKVFDTYNLKVTENDKKV